MEPEKFFNLWDSSVDNGVQLATGFGESQESDLFSEDSDLFDNDIVYEEKAPISVDQNLVITPLAVPIGSLSLEQFKNPLEMDFMEFFNFHGLLSGDKPIMSVWNDNFAIKAESDLDALRMYLVLVHGVFFTNDALSSVYDKDIDFLVSIGLRNRELDLKEITFLLQTLNSDSDLEHFCRIKSYCISTQYTVLLLKDIGLDKLDPRLLEKYARLGKDTFNKYLYALKNDIYSEVEFDTVLDNGDIESYLNSKIQYGSNPVFSLISARTDVQQISDMIGTSPSDVISNLIYRYNKSEFLLEIIKAAVNGVISNDYIEKFIITDKNRSAAEFYAQCDLNLLKSYGYDYYKATYAKDLASVLSGHTDLSKIFGNINLLSFIRKITDLKDNESMSGFDYSQFLVLTNFEKFHPFFDSLAISLDFETFNQFWIKYFLYRSGIQDAEIPSRIGSYVLFTKDGKTKMSTIIEIINNDELFYSFHNYRYCYILNDDLGLCFSTESPQKHIELTSIHYSSGLENYIRDKRSFNDIEKILKYNLFRISELIGTKFKGKHIHKEFFEFLSDIPLNKFFIYDNILSALMSHRSFLLGILCNKRSIELFQVIKSTLFYYNSTSAYAAVIRFAMKNQFGDKFIDKTKGLFGKNVYTKISVLLNERNLETTLDSFFLSLFDLLELTSHKKTVTFMIEDENLKIIYK